jgi:hypothetical protein
VLGPDTRKFRSPREKESKRRQDFVRACVSRVACLSPSCARECVSSVACLCRSLPDGGRCPENPGRALPRPRRERGRDAVWDFKTLPSRHELIPAGRTASTGSRSPREKESKRRKDSRVRVCRVWRVCLTRSGISRRSPLARIFIYIWDHQENEKVKSEYQSGTFQGPRRGIIRKKTFANTHTERGGHPISIPNNTLS